MRQSEWGSVKGEPRLAFGPGSQNSVVGEDAGRHIASLEADLPDVLGGSSVMGAK